MVYLLNFDNTEFFCDHFKFMDFTVFPVGFVIGAYNTLNLQKLPIEKTKH